MSRSADPVYISSWEGYYLGKALCLAAPFLVLLMWFATDESERTRMFYGQLTFAVCCCIPLYYLFRGLGRIWIYEDRVEVTHRGKEYTARWDEVISVEQVPFCTPPVYRLETAEHMPVYFSISTRRYAYATIGFWSWDFSGFRRYALSRMDAAGDKPTDDGSNQFTR